MRLLGLLIVAGVTISGAARAEDIVRSKIDEAMARSAAGDGKAATTGDFVLTDTEVNPVLKTLRANSIDVTALHSHMLMESPRLFFMHFWANDDAIKLAKALRAALDKTATTKG
jgi:hypothetical protein